MGAKLSWILRSSQATSGMQLSEQPSLMPHGAENPPSRALPEFLTHRIRKNNTLLLLELTKFWVLCYAAKDK